MLSLFTNLCTENPEVALDTAIAGREVGNKLFREGNADGALQKYEVS
jgi:hypothetical protein